jgi:hypothetical protein
MIILIMMIRTVGGLVHDNVLEGEQFPPNISPKPARFSLLSLLPRRLIPRPTRPPLFPHPPPSPRSLLERSDGTATRLSLCSLLPYAPWACIPQVERFSGSSRLGGSTRAPGWVLGAAGALTARRGGCAAPDGRSKGCGIVEFADAAGARRAMAELSDTELGGRNIFVREDREA